MYFGTTVDERDAFAILDRYAELGGSFIDTSNNYSFWTSETGFGGQSEALLGRWLASNPGVGIRLSTKVGAQPTRRGGFPDHVEGLREEAVRRALAESLDRLGVERVDLYWAHVEDPTVPVQALVETFGALVREGLAARWGVSNHPSWLLERIRATAEDAGLPQPGAYQERYSYIQPAGGMDVAGQPIALGMLSPDGLDFLRRNPSIDGWVYTATLQGRYDRKDRPLEIEYQHPGTERRLAVLERVADARGLQPGQVVLAWLASGSPALTPIVGVSSVEQVEQAVEGASTVLTPDELSALNTA
jgi:aryl-alcohol dehydrogenase-like predicted oxidoreductase